MLELSLWLLAGLISFPVIIITAFKKNGKVDDDDMVLAMVGFIFGPITFISLIFFMIMTFFTSQWFLNRLNLVLGKIIK